jgi:hypothetical protein
MPEGGWITDKEYSREMELSKGVHWDKIPDLIMERRKRLKNPWGVKEGEQEVNEKAVLCTSTSYKTDAGKRSERNWRKNRKKYGFRRERK